MPAPIYFSPMAPSPRKQFGSLRVAILTALVSIGLAVLVWWFFNSEFMAIDRCLDSGGRWAEGGYCEGVGTSG